MQSITSKYLLYIFLVILGSEIAGATDYILNTLEPMHPKANSISRASKTLCPLAFSNKSFKPPQFRQTSIASFYVDKKTGQRDNLRRGMQIQAMESSYKLETNKIYKQIFSDWLDMGGYNKDEIAALEKLELRLSPDRVRLFTVTEVNGKKFSALRAFDNSRQALLHGQPLPHSHPLDLIEENFGIPQEYLLKIAGINDTGRSWILGLVDIRKTYSSAIQNLLSLAANQLDIHYNSREYLSFSETKAIENLPVNIIFYARKKMKSFYKRVFEVSPLTDSNGHEITLNKNGHSYQFYHYDGAQFIEKFMNLKYHEPSFFDEQARLRAGKIVTTMQEMLKRGLKGREHSNNMAEPSINSFQQYLKEVVPALTALYTSNSDQIKTEAFIKLVKIRSRTAYEAFSIDGQAISKREIVDELLPLVPIFFPDIPKQVLNQISTQTNQTPESVYMGVFLPIISLLDTITYDTNTFFMNQITETKK